MNEWSEITGYWIRTRFGYIHISDLDKIQFCALSNEEIRLLETYGFQYRWHNPHGCEVYLFPPAGALKILRIGNDKEPSVYELNNEFWGLTHLSPLDGSCKPIVPGLKLK